MNTESLACSPILVVVCVLKNSFRNIIRVSNSLDPDQDQLPVCPYLGLNCLQMLLAEDTCTCSKT